MAFTDYTDLRTAVLEQVGDTSLADVFDRLTLLCEARLNREVKTQAQIVDTEITTVSGEADLPSDFLSVIGVYAPNGLEYVARPLQAYRSNSNYYAIAGGKILAPDATYKFDYYAKLPTLTTSATTSNWLLQAYPGVYLYGIAAEAAKYMRDRDLAGDMSGLFQSELSELRRNDHAERYSRARVQVNGCTP